MQCLLTKFYGFGYDMTMLLRVSLALFLFLTISGCANKQLESYIQDFEKYTDKVYVIDHGIHTALVVETRDIVDRLGLQDSFYSRFRFVEIGRGDAGFYQEEEPQFSTTLKALFFSTPAVLHLRAYNSPPNRRYPLSYTLEVRLSKRALEKLMDVIASSFVFNNLKAIELAKGSDEYSRFYQARGSYHMFYTCNNWTADMIQQADYPIGHRWAFFAGSVMRQIEAVHKHLGIDCRSDPGIGCIDSPVSDNSR